MPAAIKQRWGHSAVVFGSGVYFRVVVLFGGSDNDSIKSGNRISEATMLLLGNVVYYVFSLPGFLIFFS